LVRDLNDGKRVRNCFAVSVPASVSAFQRTYTVRIKESAIKSMFPNLSAKSLRATIAAKGRGRPRPLSALFTDTQPRVPGWQLFKKNMVGKRMGPVTFSFWKAAVGNARTLTVYIPVSALPRASQSHWSLFRMYCLLISCSF